VNDNNGLVYYSLSAEAYGNPLPGRSISIKADGCPTVKSADGKTYACAQGAAFTYTLCG